MNSSILETIIEVYEVGFYVDEKIYCRVPAFIDQNRDSYLVESNVYGPFSSRQAANYEAKRLNTEKQRIFENLPPLVLKFISDSARNNELLVHFYYEVREERKEVSKEVMQNG